MERNISLMEAPKEPLPRKKRVAAYCRVSGGRDEQLHSLSSQVSFYSGLIQRNKDWEYVGVFADEAATGTKESRPEFQRLLKECRGGNVDLILTKSLSRFARNTVTTLALIRELRLLGVDVWFERENIHSMSGDGEFMLTILASFAQEESLSASENQKWRVRKNFSEGRPVSTTMYGYQLVDGVFVAIPEEAAIVKAIFADYLSGLGKTAIVKKLNQAGIAAKHGGEWRESVIGNILQNEKYAGDMLLQKTFITDHLSKKKVKNNGQLPKYYVKDSHEAIIDRDTFDAVQAEIKRRASMHSPPKPRQDTYLFTGKIVCEQCGKHYRRKTQSENPVWICSTFNRLGKAYCASQQIPEHILLELVNGEPFSQLRIPEANTVVIVKPDGEKITKHWQNSRRDSWTDEMRAAARERMLQWRSEK